MLPLNPVLQDFPSDNVREQFDKFFSGKNYVPTSPKIHDLRARHGKPDSKSLNPMEIKLNLTR